MRSLLAAALLSAIPLPALACLDASGVWDTTYSDGMKTEDTITQHGCARVELVTVIDFQGRKMTFSYDFPMDGTLRPTRNRATGAVDGWAAYHVQGPDGDPMIRFCIPFHQGIRGNP